MKKLRLLFLMVTGLLASANLLAYTITISGTVTDIANGSPVANHQVHIQDSTGGFFPYSNNVYTNSSGFYTVSILNAPSGICFLMSTLDCYSITHSQTGCSQSGSSITADFQICTGTPPPTMTVIISGTVTDIANGNPVPSHQVHIQDSSGGAFPYSNNVYTNSSGFYTLTITNVPTGVWFLVSTLDCYSVGHYQYVWSSNSPITANFQICVGTPPPTITVTISGTVTDIANGNPVPNHTVVIQTDSSSGGFQFYDQPITNSAGFYSVTIQNVPQGTLFTVGTYDCNYIWNSQTVNGNNTPITVNFQICTGSQTLYYLSGLVFTGNSMLDRGWVDLIEVDSSNTAIIVDTWYIQDSAAGHFHFFNVPAGNYYFLATVGENSTVAGQYAPTYYDTTLYWNNAILVQPQVMYPPFDIHMLALIACPPGNGSINGVINQNFKTTVPVANAEVLLLDQSNQPLAYTKTNANGEYTFQNIAYGTYVVYPEITAVTTIPSTVTLTAGNPSATVNFLLENGTIYTGIKEITPMNMISISEVFPNPPADIANIMVVSASEKTVTLTILNSHGQSLKVMPFNLWKGENTIRFETSGFSEGMYYARIETKDGGITKKFVVIK